MGQSLADRLFVISPLLKNQISLNKQKITAKPLHQHILGSRQRIIQRRYICGVYTRCSTVRNARSRLAVCFEIVSLNKVLTTYLVCLIHCNCVVCACEFEIFFQSHDRGQWNSKSDQKHAAYLTQLPNRFRPKRVRLHCLPLHDRYSVIERVLLHVMECIAHLDDEYNFIWLKSIPFFGQMALAYRRERNGIQYLGHSTKYERRFRPSRSRDFV